jgi:hypothetical protein
LLPAGACGRNSRISRLPSHAKCHVSRVDPEKWPENMGDPTGVSRYCGSGGKDTDPALQRKLGNLKKMSKSMD